MRRKRLLTFFARINVVALLDVVVSKPSDQRTGAAAHSTCWAMLSGGAKVVKDGTKAGQDCAPLQINLSVASTYRFQPVEAARYEIQKSLELASVLQAASPPRLY